MRESELFEVFGGIPLSVVFAATDAIEAARAGAASAIPLEPPFHVSDDDAYVVLPDDIGLELVDIFDDADEELLAECWRDGLLVLGAIEREGPGRVALHVEACAGVQSLLDAGLPYDAEIGVGDGGDPVLELNALEPAQVTVSSGLIDEDGLDAVLGRASYVGRSWTVPKTDRRQLEVDPTYVWSRRLPDGRVGLEAALFCEYEELVLLLRPAALVPRLEQRAAL